MFYQSSSKKGKLLSYKSTMQYRSVPGNQ